MPSPHARHWTLDPAVRFLNHGSFGACPRPVLEAQTDLRARLEHQPVRFLQRDFPTLLDTAREALAAFLKADPAHLVFVANATSAVNAVLRSLPFQSGDEIVTTDHDYNACRCVLQDTADRAGARLIVARVPFPLTDEQEIIEPILAATTARTRLVFLDHITSPTALVFPVKTLVRLLHERGIPALIDGAHAPGAVPLDLDDLAPDYYTGNLHKWVCAPKGAAFLYVRPDRQAVLRPAIVSHGENTRRPGRSHFHDRFDWPGTLDPTAWLAVPVALRFMGGLLPGGWGELYDRNRDLAIVARAQLAGLLGVPLPAPNSLLASMATLPLPAAFQRPAFNGERLDPLQDRLLEQHHIEVPIMRWGTPPRRHLRLSAQAYNHLDDYRALATALTAESPRE